MSTTISTGWLKDKKGEKFAPKTLLSKIQTDDGVLLEQKIQEDLLAFKNDAVNDSKEYTDNLNSKVDSKLSELEEKVNNSAVQPDWNQNDETAKEYIKNKPFYVTREAETNIIVNQILPETSVYFEYIAEYDILPTDVRFEVGKTYTVIFDGVTYECIGRNDKFGAVYIGSQSVGNEWQFTETIESNEPFFIVTNDSYSYDIPSNTIVVSEGSNTHTIAVSTPTQETIPAEMYIDPKYVEHFQPDWNENDETKLGYVKNRPFYTPDPVVTQTEKVLVEETTLDFESSNETAITLSTQLKEGQTYFVTFDGVQYECLARNDGYDQIYIGNQIVSNGWEFPETIESNEPFFIYYDTIRVTDNSTHNISITTIDTEVKQDVVQLDEKYISSVDWKKVKNKPFENGETVIVNNTIEFYNSDHEVRYTNIWHKYNETDELPIIEGDKYVVYLEGNSYECECVLIRDDSARYGYSLAIGNDTLINYPYNSIDHTREPFCIYAVFEDDALTKLYSVALYINFNDTSDAVYTRKVRITHIEEKLSKSKLPEGIELTHDITYDEYENIHKEYKFKVDADVVANSNSNKPISLVELHNEVNSVKKGFILEDIDNGNHYIIQMKNGILVSRAACKEIVITKLPDKIDYNDGDYFDPSGMVVTAVYYDGTTKEITDYTYSETVANNSVTITYEDVCEVSIVLNFTTY